MAKEYILHQYYSIHSFVKEAKKRASKKDASHSTKGSWCGTDTFEQAADYAMYGGWEPQFAPKFRNVFEDLVPKLRKFTDLHMERFPNVNGDEVNVAEFLNGNPDHMVDWVPQENMVTKRALCLLIGHSISSGCSAEELFVRGQAIVGLVRALSLLGFELEIWSEESLTGSRNEAWSMLTRLHAAGEIMDTSAVEFAVGNPAWLRRLLFGYQEGEPIDIRRDFGFGSSGEFWGGYGHVTAIQHGNLVGADLELNLGRTWFGEGRVSWDSDRMDEVAQAGVDWVVGQLKALGVLDTDATLEWDL